MKRSEIIDLTGKYRQAQAIEEQIRTLEHKIESVKETRSIEFKDGFGFLNFEFRQCGAITHRIKQLVISEYQYEINKLLNELDKL